MSAPIWFNIREAREQLERGAVYTLRAPRGTGLTRAIWGSRRPGGVHRIAPVFVTLARANASIGHLRRFVKFSGFASVAEWRAHAAPGATHLYLVTLADLTGGSRS